MESKMYEEQEEKQTADLCEEMYSYASVLWKQSTNNIHDGGIRKEQKCQCERKTQCNMNYYIRFFPSLSPFA